jgi:hypothetical protein
MQFSTAEQTCYYYDFSTGEPAAMLPRLKPKGFKQRPNAQQHNQRARNRLVSMARRSVENPMNAAGTSSIVTRVFAQVNKERVRVFAQP